MEEILAINQVSHLLQTIYPNESKGKRSLSLHWPL